MLPHGHPKRLSWLRSQILQGMWSKIQLLLTEIWEKNFAPQKMKEWRSLENSNEWRCISSPKHGDFPASHVSYHPQFLDYSGDMMILFDTHGVLQTFGSAEQSAFCWGKTSVVVAKNRFCAIYNHNLYIHSLIFFHTSKTIFPQT